MKSFIGITGHYILDWTMKSVMLDCRRFKGRHTAEYIYQQFHETVSAFDIASKITNIVTDNAANMVKAFKVDLPGYTCVAMESDISDDTDISDDDDDDTSDDMSDSKIDPAVFDHLPAERDSCFAHTSQLVVHDGLKQAGPHITKLIAQAAKIVSFARKSVLATDILEGEKCLQAANTTRWN